MVVCLPFSATVSVMGCRIIFESGCKPTFGKVCDRPEQSPVDVPKIFVVRMVGPRQPFGWEIRKFSSFVVSMWIGVQL